MTATAIPAAVAESNVGQLMSPGSTARVGKEGILASRREAKDAFCGGEPNAKSINGGSTMSFMD